MSSILISGMELPADGCYHLVCIYADGTVVTGGGEYRAVPIHKPYGRLIDADALCKTLRNLAENEYTPETFANWIEHHIDTIIPASEEEIK